MRVFLLGIHPSSWRAMQIMPKPSISSFSSISSLSSISRPAGITMRAAGYATQKELPPGLGKEFKGIISATNREDAREITRGEREQTKAAVVLQAAKRTSYTASAFIFFSVTVAILYSIAQLLFDPMSENSVFTKCVKRIETEVPVHEALGIPIHTYGYSVRSHPFVYTKFTNDKGNDCVKIEFDIEGTKTKGKVHAEIERTNYFTTEIVSLVIKLPGWRRKIDVV